jgi:hypothetical protein
LSWSAFQHLGSPVQCLSAVAYAVDQFLCLFHRKPVLLSEVADFIFLTRSHSCAVAALLGLVVGHRLSPSPGRTGEEMPCSLSRESVAGVLKRGRPRLVLPCAFATLTAAAVFIGLPRSSDLGLWLTALFRLALWAALGTAVGMAIVKLSTVRRSKANDWLGRQPTTKRSLSRLAETPETSRSFIDDKDACFRLSEA